MGKKQSVILALAVAAAMALATNAAAAGRSEAVRAASQSTAQPRSFFSTSLRRSS